jgi:hypothetical protein
MASEAHSYFRYNTHLSPILMLSLALAVCELMPRRAASPLAGRGAATAALIVALAAPVALAERLRFDVEMPQPLVWDLAAALKPYLHDHERIALLLPGDAGGEVGDLLTEYLASAPPRRRGLDVKRFAAADRATLDAAVAAGYDLAVITCTPQGFADLPAGQAALLRHDEAGWHPLGVWPYSSGIALSHWQRQRRWPALCRG